MEATFTTQAWPDDPIEATLTEIGDEVNTTNRTVTIKLKPKDSSKLLAGMFVSLKLITEEVDNCLTVPNDAISSYLDKNVVYIVKDNVATRQTVTTGSSNATVTVITEGLQAGDEVVTAGSVTDQTKVNIVK
jgi:RND family efflux transporter MFP subunit